MGNKPPIHLLLADDDSDDRFMFAEALSELPIETTLETVCDGQYLMDHLNNNPDKLPNLLFLDLNMPRKKGCECLVEIKSNVKLRHIPVIIYSTYLSEDRLDFLYKNGAINCISKPNYCELKKILMDVLTLLQKKKLTPSREKYLHTFQTQTNS
jgi:CheY-like chemotaxis protein